MKLVFPGTRGYIDEHSPQHSRHSSLLVEYRGRSILIDCGEDWLDHLGELGRRGAVIITHAHPDHAGGLKKGWDRPVWAGAEAWEGMKSFPLKDRRVLAPRMSQTVAGISFEAFPVEHSLRAPATGLRVRAGRVTVFYVPDVVFIEHREEALRGVDVYVGDGATLKHGLIRRRGARLIGHTPVQTQLTWCAKAGVPRAIFSHCGSGIVRDHERAAGIVRALGEERGVEARLAYDGLEVTVRRGQQPLVCE